MIIGKRPIGTVAYMGGVPAVLEEFCWAFAQLVQYNADYLCEPGERVHYVRSTVSYHAYARNSLVDRMLGDWLLMLDTDHQFEPDLAARMVLQLERHDIDVLAGLYCYKQPPHNPVAFNAAGHKVSYLGDWDRTVSLFEVGAAGAGSLLVRRRVFERIRHELRENPFEVRKAYSEDHSFFDRCRELGIKSYCCPAIESPHLTVRPVTLKDYAPDRSLLSDRIEVEGRV